LGAVCAHFSRQGAIHFDSQGWGIGDLEDVRVDDAGDVLELARELRGDGIRFVVVRP
jgi:hypothetical protein